MAYSVKIDRETGITSVVQTQSGHATIDLAFDEAVTRDPNNYVRILCSGEFAAGVEVDKSGLNIEIPRKVTLHNATSGTNGMFKFTGDNITIFGGGRIMIPDGNWVDDQVVVEFSGGNNIMVDGMVFQAGQDGLNNNALELEVGGKIASNDTANPMVMLKSTNTSNMVVRHNSFHPGQAVRMLEGSQGNGLIVHGNQFCNTDNQGLDSSVSEFPSPRYGFQMILVTGTDWGQIINNRFWGVGDAAPLLLEASNEVEFAVRLIGVGTAGNEQGHWVVANNHCEAFACPKPFQLWGVLSCEFNGNLTGFMGLSGANSPAASGEAVIVLTGTDGTASGQACSGIHIAGNNMHNPAATDGAAIYIDAADMVTIMDNSFASIACNNVIRIDPDSVGEVTVSNNFFARSTTAATSPVRLTAGTYAANKTITFANNTVHLMTGALVDITTNSPTINGKVLDAGIQDSNDGNDVDASTLIQNLTTNFITP